MFIPKEIGERDIMDEGNTFTLPVMLSGFRSRQTGRMPCVTVWHT